VRVFLCSYSGFTMAIPINSVSSIILFKEKTEKEIEYNNKNILISLPLLLGCGSCKIKHGIIVKGFENIRTGTFRENQFILLTTEIECETNITDAAVFSVPKNLGVTRFARFFNNIIFNDTGGLTLMLDPLQLIKNIQKELTK